jgi:hypothetical protein
MLQGSNLTTGEVLAVFTEEVAARGGRVTDTFHDGRRLFTRAVLPHVEEVRHNDRLQGGVAVKALDERVWVYPYLFRLVCRNGAIVAETLGSRSIEDLHVQDPDMALRSVRECIEACCAEEMFTDTVRKMRRACQTQADLALNVLPLLSRSGAHASAELLSRIMEQFFREGDPSQFGLANAVTAVARDTADPELRWDLEELGGGVAVGTAPPQPADGGRAGLARPGRAVAVG